MFFLLTQSTMNFYFLSRMEKLAACVLVLAEWEKTAFRLSLLLQFLLQSFLITPVLLLSLSVGLFFSLFLLFILIFNLSFFWLSLVFSFNFFFRFLFNFFSFFFFSWMGFFLDFWSLGYEANYFSVSDNLGDSSSLIFIFDNICEILDH